MNTNRERRSQDFQRTGTRSSNSERERPQPRHCFAPSIRVHWCSFVVSYCMVTATGQRQFCIAALLNLEALISVNLELPAALRMILDPM